MNIQSQKHNIDIVEIIARHTDIGKHGKEYIGLCPFHTEKTPSFTVNPAKQFFHCFGCGAHGDVIEFIQKFNNCDFKQACQHLNIELPDNSRLSTGARVKSKRQQQANKRHNERQQRLYREFQEWIFWYEGLLIDLIGAIERIGPTIKPDELDFLAGCIRKKSTWKYHFWLIQNGTEDDLYELWAEQRR